jgi:hypothetical protein
MVLLQDGRGAYHARLGARLVGVRDGGLYVASGPAADLFLKLGPETDLRRHLALLAQSCSPPPCLVERRQLDFI